MDVVVEVNGRFYSTNDPSRVLILVRYDGSVAKAFNILRQYPHNIGTLREAVAEYLNTIPSAIRLNFHGMRLRDRTTVEEAGLEDGSIVEAVVTDDMNNNRD